MSTDTRKALELAREALQRGCVIKDTKAIAAIDAALSAHAAPASVQPLTKSQVMTALAMCPTDMSHPQKCEWIAQALNGIGQASVQPLTDVQVFADDVFMSLNASLGLSMAQIMALVRCVERAHGIGQGGAA